jgi:NAD(P)-dependent dehydrogenase (short-subunit alcohol dehydrogenase family)
MPSMASQEQRTAIVTGAAGGLGLAVAALLLREGTQVSMVDVDGGRLEAAADGLPESPQLIAADLSRTAECDRAVAEAIDRWGRVDILVNCAAILRRVDLADLDEETFAHVVNTNLRSVVWLCRAVLPGMEERAYGRIVNLTSVGIHTGGYSLTSAVYECTKAAIHNLTKTLARSLAPKGILVNSVAPGGMRTRMILDETPPAVLESVMADIPLRRLAEPAEVAEVIAFLASDRNTYASGASFDVNGGVAMS